MNFMQKQKVGVILAAGGIGERVGGTQPKQFLKIKEKPIIQLTLEIFQKCEEINCIVIASHTNFIKEVQFIVEKNNFTKVRSIIPGGLHRQDSVWNGIRDIINYDVDILLIHDAVRPFVSNELVLNIINAVKLYGAAAPALTPKDTIKESDGKGFLIKTSDRSEIFAVQTPQGFLKDLIIEAYEKAYSDKIYTTDDASLVERLGKKIKIVKGDNRNIKITTKEDLEYANVVLSDYQ